MHGLNEGCEKNKDEDFPNILLMSNACRSNNVFKK